MDELWEGMKCTIKETVKEDFREDERIKNRKPWFEGECVEAVKRSREVRLKYLGGKESSENFRMMQRRASKLQRKRENSIKKRYQI